MGFPPFLLIFLALCPAFLAQIVEDTALVIDGTVKIAETDANYVCATLDWWPKEKCNYNECPWGYTSLMNLDLSHPFLANSIKAFNPLRLRLGGSLQNRVIYDVGNLESRCHPFTKQGDGLFGFSKGCLHMNRWDELNSFFKKTGALVTFGLNALHGRQRTGKRLWGGNWDSSNAHDFINYTISRGYQIHSWEFGNELSGKGIGANVDAEQYGTDVIHLNNLIDQLYKHFQPRPLLLAPGGFYDKEWYEKLLEVSGPGTVDALTHHIYNLGPGGWEPSSKRELVGRTKLGSDRNLVNKILNPLHLNKIADTFSNLTQTIAMNGPWTSAWVGESGGAFNNGGHNVSNTFVNSFWYLDQLGMAAKYLTKVYCRQTFVGGNYGLLDTSTFIPNPDYYSALLWHRLMGKGVLAVSRNSSSYLRSYAHCTRDRAGVTLLLINLSNQTQYGVSIESSATTTSHANEKSNHKKSFIHGLKKTFSWVGSKSSDVTLSREEYHLTPLDGNLHSKIMLLNGLPLQLTEDGDIPSLSPVIVNIKSPISVAPLSIKFLVFPNYNSPGCR
ncbi:heparanase-like protein 2 isoform X1 [Nicotiana tomentosiformis]|uniref:heparanase-like protein 2 isoform X1 n=1 Tax=Nicotiana tomentosiformis TaxID=4098 RepID=UPI00051C9537|nr:heparanase-like protein 2 isoform X1 [Nicotiana tomentosiformis]XP_018624807.1 heparanase-like protein 2 isoform X1 [Nicotiana tomentosiformis]XP_033510823.1 heparanase-like protein 2 isoform X1 [Nicotiana tomentosiformis]